MSVHDRTAMNYVLVGRWNNTKVIEAKCTGVIAYSIAKHLLIENFGGETARNCTLTLDEVLAMQPHDIKSWKSEDLTGKAFVSISRD